MSVGVVLVHGSGMTSACWEPLLDYLQTPAIAVDLPGRGRRPADLSRVDVSEFASAVAEDITSSGWDQVVLVGHSLAGLTLPRVPELVPGRIARLVFVSCALPPHGSSVLDALDPSLQEYTRNEVLKGGGISPVLDREMAVALFCNDLSDAETEWMLARMVPEASSVLLEPNDLTSLPKDLPRTWVRLLRDVAAPTETQNEYINNLGGADVVDIDCGHMAMVSNPAALAAIIDSYAGVQSD
jgi:pimeloyl-ACP methyl ester carboxylesterase